MKKLLFVTPDLKTGGIASSFLNLMKELSNLKECDIDVLLFDDADADRLPKTVNILPTNKLLRLLVVQQSVINSESFLLGLVRLVLGFLKKYTQSGLIYKIIMSTYEKVGVYDYAISFAQSGADGSLYGGFNEFVLYRAEARCKISFLHCDYMNCGIKSKYKSRIYNQFDKIAAVSEGVKESFSLVERNLERKTYVVHNCHDTNMILELSRDNTVEYDTSVTNILTVARLSDEKGHNRTLNALREIKKKGIHDFCWHVVGGSDRQTEKEFVDKVCEYGLSGNVVFYGNQNNPYRFFINADCLLVPSYHEAAPMVFGEAEILGLPVVTTNTLSADELVKKRQLGWVCDNTDDALSDVLEYVLTHRQDMRSLKNRLKVKQQYNNVEAVKEFLRLLND